MHQNYDARCESILNTQKNDVPVSNFAFLPSISHSSLYFRLEEKYSSKSRILNESSAYVSKQKDPRISNCHNKEFTHSLEISDLDTSTTSHDSRIKKLNSLETDAADLIETPTPPLQGKHFPGSATHDVVENIGTSIHTPHLEPLSVSSTQSTIFPSEVNRDCVYSYDTVDSFIIWVTDTEYLFKAHHRCDFAMSQLKEKCPQLQMNIIQLIKKLRHRLQNATWNPSTKTLSVPVQVRVSNDSFIEFKYDITLDVCSHSEMYNVFWKPYMQIQASTWDAFKVLSNEFINLYKLVEQFNMIDNQKLKQILSNSTIEFIKSHLIQNLQDHHKYSGCNKMEAKPSTLSISTDTIENLSSKIEKGTGHGATSNESNIQTLSSFIVNTLEERQNGQTALPCDKPTGIHWIPEVLYFHAEQSSYCSGSCFESQDMNTSFDHSQNLSKHQEFSSNMSAQVKSDPESSFHELQETGSLNLSTPGKSNFEIHDNCMIYSQDLAHCTISQSSLDLCSNASSQQQTQDSDLCTPTSEFGKTSSEEMFSLDVVKRKRELEFFIQRKRRQISNPKKQLKKKLL